MAVYDDPETTVPPAAKPFNQAIQSLFMIAVERWRKHLNPNGGCLNPTDPKAYRAWVRATMNGEWILALSRTLSGDTHYLLPFRFRRFRALRPKTPIPRIPGIPAFDRKPRKPSTEFQRERARTNAIRRAFAVLSIAEVAKKIARRLAIPKGGYLYPDCLMHLTETPAAFNRREYPPAKPEGPPEYPIHWFTPRRARMAPKPPAPAPEPAPEPNLETPDPEAPPFHKRE